MIKERKQKKTQFMIIAGDFNAKIGTGKDGDTEEKKLTTLDLTVEARKEKCCLATWTKKKYLALIPFLKNPNNVNGSDPA